jgi:poly(3-hydroxybutyrate) depolymerase
VLAVLRMRVRATAVLPGRIGLLWVLATPGCHGVNGGQVAEADLATVDPSGDGGVDAAQADGAAACTLCDGKTGLCSPNPACSIAAPCAGPDGGMVTSGFELPTCKGTGRNGRPVYDDSPAQAWTDAASGETRAACVYRPAGMSSASLRPLVVYIHGSYGSADDVYDFTSLRSKAITANLSGDAARLGFVLAADQGRTLPNPNGYDNTARRHDIYYRDLGAPSANPDIRAVDHLIDDLVAQGGIDTHQIYIVGWSNGAFFAQLYAIARYGASTTGGHHIAASAAYAGGSPFENLTDSQQPSCQYSPYPKSQVPIYLIHRDCDAAVGCDATQRSNFSQPPGYDVEGWVATAVAQAGLGDSALRDVIIDNAGTKQMACASVCGKIPGLINHARWPDGIDDQGTDWEPIMLLFLRQHPLP